MEINIQMAEKGQAPECLACIAHSALWETYFKSKATVVDDIEEMIGRRQIHVALNQHHECIGFMGVIHNGCFRKFSYLSLIAVESGHRNQGVGKALLHNFEESGFQQADKVFLLVSDFNARAQALYRKLGYQRVGEIPDMFKGGVTEQIMVKYKKYGGG